MFLGPHFRSVVSIGKMSQEFKYGTLINPKEASFFKIDFKVGYPQINLSFCNGKLITDKNIFIVNFYLYPCI